MPPVSCGILTGAISWSLVWICPRAVRGEGVLGREGSGQRAGRSIKRFEKEMGLYDELKWVEICSRLLDRLRSVANSAMMSTLERWPRPHVLKLRK